MGVHKITPENWGDNKLENERNRYNANTQRLAYFVFFNRNNLSLQV